MQCYRDDNWRMFMKRFISSVQHITGQSLDVVTEEQIAVPEIAEELESLRTRVDDLTDEVCL